MINERYSIAITEVLHYLKGIKQDDINKIPKNFLLFLNENASNNYVCDFDYNKPLKELRLSNEAKGLIAMICLNYWCETEEQKKGFKNHLNTNELKFQEELKLKYNADDIFKKTEDVNFEDDTIKINNKLPLKVKKDNIFKRFFNFVIGLFK